MKSKIIKISPICLGLLCAFSPQAEEFDGEQLVVTGSRIEQKLEDVAGSVSVVTEAQIERQMVTDLRNMFKYDPSISATGSGAEPQTLTVRGVGGNRLVYVKDGRRINDGYAGGGGFIVGRGYFDTEDIKQVEVAKGAASSLYGSDGLGGLVIISTKDPEDYLNENDSFTRLVTGYSGENEQSKVSVTHANTLGDWNVSASATYRNGSEVQNFKEDLPEYDADSTSLLLKATNQVDEQRWVKFTLDLFQQEVEQIVTPDSYETVDEDDSYSLAFDYKSSISTSWYDRWEGHVSVSKYRQGSDQVRLSTRGYTDFNDYRFEQNIVGLKALFTKELSLDTTQHTLVYGVDFDFMDTKRPRLKTRINADGSTEFENQGQKAFPGADTLLAGLYAQDNIEFKDSNWSLVAGIRLDYYALEAKDDVLYTGSEFDDITERAMSPKLAALYSINDNWTIYGQYAQGFKIPPHDQAYQSHGVEPFYQILPNNDLDAEESDSIEFGVKSSGENYRLQANVFYSQFDNFIETQLIATEPTFIPGVNKAIYQYRNVDETEIRGIEFSSTYWLMSDLSIQANLAYTKGENKDTDESLTSISPLSGSVIASYEMEQWDVSAAWRFARSMNDVPTDRSGNDLITSSGYGVLDLYAQYSADNWSLTFGVDNVTDKEYVPYELIAGQAADADVNQYTQPGRTFSAQLIYQF